MCLDSRLLIQYEIFICDNIQLIGILAISVEVYWVPRSKKKFQIIYHREPYWSIGVYFFFIISNCSQRTLL